MIQCKPELSAVEINKQTKPENKTNEIKPFTYFWETGTSKSSAHPTLIRVLKPKSMSPLLEGSPQPICLSSLARKFWSLFSFAPQPGRTHVFHNFLIQVWYLLMVLLESAQILYQPPCLTCWGNNFVGSALKILCWLLAARNDCHVIQ